MPLPRKLAFPDRWVEKLVQEIGLPCEDEPITFPDKTTPIKFIVELNENEFTKLYSALLTGADLSYPDEAHEITWLLLKQLECPVSICDDLLECFMPLFEGLGDQITNVQNTVNEIQETLEENAAQPLPLPAESDASAICGGAYALVNAMHRMNQKLYKEAEDTFVDNAAEWITTILDMFPTFSAQGVDAGAGLANTLAQNNVTAYNDSYELMVDTAACELKCYIEANDGELTYDVWGDWLDALPSLFTEPNFAAELFAKYSPLRQTFLNQIAQFFNQEQSLQSYFDELWNAYFVGTDTPETCSCGCLETYCDAMAEGLGAMSHELSATYPFGSWDDCTPNGQGESGGVWTAGEGEAGGAIVGLTVCADTGGGVPLSQASVVVDLTAEYRITNVVMRYIKVASGGGGRQNISFYDGTGAFISTVTREDFTANTWLTYEVPVSVEGVRYISFNATQNEGTPKVSSVCVSYR